MTSRPHITVTPLTPEDAVRRIPDIYDVFDCQPDPEADDLEDGTGFVLLAFMMLSFVFAASCVVAVLYAFGIM